MERCNPFPCERVFYCQNIPSPIVQVLEHDDDDNEVVKEFSPQDFYKKYPLATKCFSLDELLAAGIPIKSVDTHLYEGKDPTDRPWNISDLYEDAKVLAEQISDKSSDVEP